MPNFTLRRTKPGNDRAADQEIFYRRRNGFQAHLGVLGDHAFKPSRHTNSSCIVLFHEPGGSLPRVWTNTSPKNSLKMV